MSENSKINGLKYPELIPEEYIDTFEKDCEELIKEEEDIKNSLDDKFKNRVFDLFREGYKTIHVQNIIHSQLVQNIDLDCTT
ncbi:hypothetical protein [Aquimarina aggregata]|uniref:hypothetical protein n=1 Tax=Aquimarina aggregata TaxID=1642818 RepID=UPI0024905B9C|nr:hypothetical protein [Aquimarina aggregata]